jgi:hypothetical protein
MLLLAWNWKSLWRCSRAHTSAPGRPPPAGPHKIIFYRCDRMKSSISPVATAWCSINVQFIRQLQSMSRNKRKLENVLPSNN